MRASQKRITRILVGAIVIGLSCAGAYAASMESPKGKRIPVRIIDESAKEYKAETDLPGGGRIIFNINKEKVDPHGTVPGRARIEDTKGKVEIRRAGRTLFTSAAKGMSVNPGDEIRTGERSKMVITLEKSAINGMGANSQFTLKSFETNPETRSVQIKIGLPNGQLWSEVGRLKTRDSKFEIETPTAVTGVRGTVFRVDVKEKTGATSVSVVSGEVGVRSPKVEAPEVVLRKKEALVVEPEKKPSKLEPAELSRHFKEVSEDWTTQSEYFKSVTPLAGIGRVEEIQVQPDLSEEKRRRAYDAIQAGWEKASEDFFQIDKALKIFYVDFAHFPTVKEGGLQALVTSTGSPQWNGPYTEEDYLVDHYGVPYGYKVLRDIHGSPFVEVTTYGYDKKPGTSDDRRKLILEEDARRWEDRKNYR